MRLIDADVFKKYLMEIYNRYAREIEESERQGNDSGASYLRTHKELIANILLNLKLQPTVNQWIPCSERVPKNKDNVLVSTEYDNVEVNYYQPNFREWYGEAYEEVIAWMPLPEPYKEEQK